MTAAYALQKMMSKENYYQVDSAGISIRSMTVKCSVRKYLKKRGVDISGHQPKQIVQSIFFASDLVIAMGLDHRDWIEDQFGVRVPLFNEICYNHTEPVLDLHEAIPNQASIEDSDFYIYNTIKFIFDSTPYLINNIHRYIT